MFYLTCKLEFFPLFTYALKLMTYKNIYTWHFIGIDGFIKFIELIPTIYVYLRYCKFYQIISSSVKLCLTYFMFTNQFGKKCNVSKFNLCLLRNEAPSYSMFQFNLRIPNAVQRLSLQEIYFNSNYNKVLLKNYYSAATTAWERSRINSDVSCRLGFEKK